MVSSYSADVISHSSSLSYWRFSAIHGFTLWNQHVPPKESHIQDRTPKYYRNAFVGMFVKQSQKPLLPLLCLSTQPSIHMVRMSVAITSLHIICLYSVLKNSFIFMSSLYLFTTCRSWKQMDQDKVVLLSVQKIMKYGQHTLLHCTVAAKTIHDFKQFLKILWLVLTRW